MDNNNSNNICIYRIKCKNNKCINKSIDNNKFCKKHIKYSNILLYDIVYNACGNKIDLLNNINIFQIFNEIFLYSGTENLKKTLFIKIIAYLFSFKNIKNLAINNNIKTKKSGKADIINDLYLILYNTFKFKDKYLNKLIIIQNCIRKYIIKKVNKVYKYEYIINKEDPFTLDNINDIPYNLKFYFHDNDNQIYCFNAIEFEYYLRKNKLHPYTKNIINNNIILKLKLFIKYNNLKLKLNYISIGDNWNTPEQAYTDVVYYMEKIGFYNNILWFNELTYTNIINIIHIYNDLTMNVNIDYKFFQNNIINNINNNNYQFIFAKEIINLFINGNNHFILCCNFIKALALVSDNFYNNVPEWLINVTNDNNINNENIFINNTFTIYLNNSNNILANENNVIQYDNIIDPTTIYYLLDMLNRNN